MSPEEQSSLDEAVVASSRASYEQAPGLCRSSLTELPPHLQSLLRTLGCVLLSKEICPSDGKIVAAVNSWAGSKRGCSFMIALLADWLRSVSLDRLESVKGIDAQDLPFPWKSLAQVVGGMAKQQLHVRRCIEKRCEALSHLSLPPERLGAETTSSAAPIVITSNAVGETRSDANARLAQFHFTALRRRLYLLESDCWAQVPTDCPKFFRPFVPFILAVLAAKSVIRPSEARAGYTTLRRALVASTQKAVSALLSVSHEDMAPTLAEVLRLVQPNPDRDPPSTVRETRDPLALVGDWAATLRDLSFH